MEDTRKTRRSSANRGPRALGFSTEGSVLLGLVRGIHVGTIQESFRKRRHTPTSTICAQIAWVAATSPTTTERAAGSTRNHLKLASIEACNLRYISAPCSNRHPQREGDGVEPSGEGEVAGVRRALGGEAAKE